MNLAEFRASLSGDVPPDSLGDALQALWWDAKGDWNRAHECAQRDEGWTGSIVHAYLHRKEGDLSNARYWYNRAGRTPPETTLAAEWENRVRELLEENPT